LAHSVLWSDLIPVLKGYCPNNIENRAWKYTVVTESVGME
jgi:hypothetical protein